MTDKQPEVQQEVILMERRSTYKKRDEEKRIAAALEKKKQIMKKQSIIPPKRILHRFSRMNKQERQFIRKAKTLNITAEQKGDISQLIIIRIMNKYEASPYINNVLGYLRLHEQFQAVLVQATPKIINILKSLDQYIAYGKINPSTLRNLLYTKGRFISDDQEPLPISDNNIIEERLGQYDILCFEDILHEFQTNGENFPKINAQLSQISFPQLGYGENYKWTIRGEVDDMDELLAQILKQDTK